VLRQVRAADAANLAARRSDPDTARFQSWETPYPLEQARSLIAAVLEMHGPASDEWYLIAVADPATDQMLGDLAVYLKWEGRTAQIGYTFNPQARGRGLATEAVSALLEHLFAAADLTRVEASIHPDNVASARVLERTGFLYEGLTRSDFWVGDVVSDTGHYAMLRLDFDAWRTRPRRAPDLVRLVELNSRNEREVLALKTHKTQEAFVAKMEASFADAMFPEVVDGAQVLPWLRAVEADGEIVGFVMLALTTDSHPEPYLWRLLVDRHHQFRGIGRQVLDAVVLRCLEWGDVSLTTSWGKGPGSPEPFYLAYGFEPTGRVLDGEIEARLSLDPSS